MYKKNNNGPGTVPCEFQYQQGPRGVFPIRYYTLTSTFQELTYLFKGITIYSIVFEHV